jgi:undecaprenyl diphosphate synthase
MTEKKIPQHVAIIMDGNRRWARAQGLEIIKGHRKVAEEMIERLTEYAEDQGISYLTLWAFSTENWQRNENEVSALMDLFRESFSKSSEKLHKRGIRINVLGNLQRFPEDIQAGMRDWLEKTRQNDRMTVSLALNYGGRDEILRATKQLLLDSNSQNWDIQKISSLTENDFSKKLDTARGISLPDPELLIRTGGEQRLSGFLPWQMTYTELYFTPTLMPDFDEKEFQKALDEFSKRQRRFGK